MEEHEPLGHSALCVRVMEAFFAKVGEDERFNNLYLDLYGMYVEVLAEELAPYAADLALEVFSSHEVIRERRRERESTRRGGA